MRIDWINNKILYDDAKFSPDALLTLLNEYVTPERKNKIDLVLKNRSNFFTPILEGLYDRGNISAVMRSAESFGFFQFHIIEFQEKFKESQRVTQGADKWLDIYKWTNTKECIHNLKTQGYKVYTTHLSSEAVPLNQIDFAQKTALIFGNEKKGVTEEALKLSDGNVLLPMAGFTQSFNISVAAALSFQYAYLQNPPKLNSSEVNLLKSSYYLNSIDWPKEALLKALNP